MILPSLNLSGDVHVSTSIHVVFKIQASHYHTHWYDTLLYFALYDFLNTIQCSV